mgnify:CR=1 FL=1
MNNIYKVIWSKAKNCYVVASEIARSHTKSATGSEKIGGVTRRSLLASLMALSLLCGGLGVASAEVDVKVNVSSAPDAVEVYTKTGVEALLDGKANKIAVEEIKNTVGDVDSGLVKKTNDNATAIEVNRTNINTLKDTVGDDTKGLTKKINDNATAINTLTTNVNAKADANTVNDISTRVGTLETTVGNATSGLVEDVNEAKTDITNIKNTIGDDTAGLIKKVNDKANASDVYSKTDAENKFADKTTTENALATKANQSELDTAAGRITAVEKKTSRINYDTANDKTTINGVGISNTQVDMGGKDITNAGALTATGKVTGDGVDAGDGAITTTGAVNAGSLKVTGEISNGNGVTTTLEKINASMEKTNQNADKVADLEKKTSKIAYDAANDKTTINGVGISNTQVDMGGKDITNAGALTATGKVTGDGVDAGDGDITTTGAVNAGSLNVTDASHLKGDVTMDKTLSVTGDTSLGALNVTGESSLKNTQVNGTLTTTGKATFKEAVDMDKGLTVTSGDTTLQNTDVKGALNVTGESNLKNTTVDGTLGVTGEATFKDKVTMEKDLEVKGELKTDKIAMENKKTDADGRHNSSTAITADYITHIGEVENSGVITKSSFTHNEKGTINYAKDGDTADWKETRSYVTASGVSNKMTDSDKNKHTYSQTATESKEQLVNGDKSKSNFEKKTAEGNTISITEKDAAGNVVQSLTNKQTVKGEKTSVTNEDSSSTINQGADQISNHVTSKDGNISSTVEVKADGITNTSDGTITNDAMNIVNKANTMDTTVTGKATESYGELETTVNGKATENYKSGLDTIVTGAENHTVTGKQTNTVGDGQINNITGGQINNILTGDQETTVSNGSIINKAENGNISNTAKNVTNEGTESVTNKAGDMTVTTDKTTGTTFGNGTPNDTTVINGGTIGTNKVNANETNTKKLTAGADDGAVGGRLTVDADGVKGSYKSGDYTSRSYILANTLKSGVDNGKEPTDADFVGSRTDHYMDGNKAKLDETVKDAAGSNVTNKTSTGTVTTITDGTTTTNTEQGVKDITNTAKNGTITNDAKDIVNIAKDTITNTAGTSITNQVNDSKVTTDVDGTTFENNTAAVSDGGATTTKINGNHITTGRVDANELNVSDKVGTNTADFSVKAGEGVKASAGNGTTTGSLDVTAEEVTTSIKSGSKENTVISTVDGTSFINSEAAAPVTGASGANPGTADRTTIKGNTITTGKVTMDYAEVMKDLGVHGNAKVDQNLEVGGTSTLKGDVTMESNATVKKDLTVKGTTTTKTLKVTENAEIDGTLKVAKKATFEDSVSIAKDLSVGGDVTAKSYKVGDKTYIDANGINANDQKITNVADGSISEGSKDAVNGGQLYGVKRDLEHQVDKVGANAAAMANLRPMEFDPSSKWNIAAAIGNYGSETAAALGAFYRPNDDVMVNLSTAFGTGENMVGGGVSVRLGKSGNKLSREETNALKAQVDDLTARMDALLSVLNPNMSKDFPDVPENHWAYEAVSRLAGNDIVQGYPDGEFHGERTMTRYEMAEIIYNALSRGAEAEKELVEEFKPELQAMAASEKATAEKAEG